MRTMKTVVVSGLLVLALCLTAVAASGAAEQQETAQGETGTCYHLIGSRPMEGLFTQQDCWEAGGNSWRSSTAAAKIIPNPDPE